MRSFFSPAVIGNLNLTYVNIGSLMLNVMLGKWFSNLTDIGDNWYAGAKPDAKSLESKVFR